MQEILEQINNLKEFVQIENVYVTLVNYIGYDDEMDEIHTIFTTAQLPFIDVRDGKLISEYSTKKAIVEHSIHWGLCVDGCELTSKRISRAIHSGWYKTNDTGIRVEDYIKPAYHLTQGKFDKDISYAERIDNNIFIYSDEVLKYHEVKHDSKTNILLSIVD